MKFCEWLRASGHTHRGLSCHELLRLWREENARDLPELPTHQRVTLSQPKPE